MEDKVITEKESIDLIASMIQSTRNHIRQEAGNVILAWGYIVTIISLAVFIIFYITHDFTCYYLWYAIPAIGIPLHCYLAQRIKKEIHIITSIDRYITSIWGNTGIIFIISSIICLILGMTGLNAWGALYLILLPLLGFATLSSGVIIKENSMIIGGIISIIIGTVFIICYICEIDRLIYFDKLLLAISFALMMIIPGHKLNKKAETK